MLFFHTNLYFQGSSRIYQVALLFLDGNGTIVPKPYTSLFDRTLLVSVFFLFIIFTFLVFLIVVVTAVRHIFILVGLPFVMADE